MGQWETSRASNKAGGCTDAPAAWGVMLTTGWKSTLCVRPLLCCAVEEDANEEAAITRPLLQAASASSPSSSSASSLARGGCQPGGSAGPIMLRPPSPMLYHTTLPCKHPPRLPPVSAQARRQAWVENAPLGRHQTRTQGGSMKALLLPLACCAVCDKHTRDKKGGGVPSRAPACCFQADGRWQPSGGRFYQAGRAGRTSAARLLFWLRGVLFYFNFSSFSPPQRTGTGTRRYK